jgi:hypothetical protein
MTELRRKTASGQEIQQQEAQKGNLGYLVFLEMLPKDEYDRGSQKVLSVGMNLSQRESHITGLRP